MYAQPIGRWADALRHTLTRIYEPTTRLPVPWILSGDVALALQGVDVTPQSIEFRAISPYAVAYFSGFMRPYEVPANATTVIYKRGGGDAPSGGWRSNVHQHVVAWGNERYACWMGRWNVEGYPVEAFFAKGAASDPLAGITREDIRRVRFEEMDVAVAPIEFLLADSADREKTQTTNRILHTLRGSGYERSALNKAVDVLPSDKANRLLRLLEIRLIAG